MAKFIYSHNIRKSGAIKYFVIDISLKMLITACALVAQW